MILAAAAALSYYDAAIATVGDGIATADLGGSATTTAFTDAVIARVQSLLG
jgi:isocitrate/isopropylmalate dehydrogenase